ncbi:MAG: oxidoreductase, partial [Planctomycetaceae bacterium]|nr:oxidoreductase [Planctomycetaceae bacterium]
MNSPTPAPPYKVIGTRPIRHDGADKVTGKAKYGADVKFTKMVYGKVLRSPHAHAKILSIDVSAAKQHPGVLAVITSSDMPDLVDKMVDLGEGVVNLAHLGDNILARQKVFYKGQAVAAVAAINSHAAAEAAQLIKVEYEPMPAVTWVLDAMREDAP